MSCGWKSKLAISLTPFIFLENKSGKCFAKYSFMIGVQTCFQFSGCKDYIFPGRSRLSKSAGSGLKFKTPPPSGSVFPGSLLSWVTALSGIWHFLPCGRIRASLVAMTCTHHVLKVKCWRMRTNIFFRIPGHCFGARKPERLQTKSGCTSNSAGFGDWNSRCWCHDRQFKWCLKRCWVYGYKYSIWIVFARGGTSKM